jgi:hypothetical protein
MIDKSKWILRNVIVWHKLNSMPQSVQDRFTVDWEYIFFFTKSKKYYFEQILEPYTTPINRWGGERLYINENKVTKSQWDENTGQGLYRNRNIRPNATGKNKRCVWAVNTKPLKEAHFAPFPEKLIEPMIQAGCPKQICEKCGHIRKKIRVRKSVPSQRETFGEQPDGQGQQSSSGWKAPEFEDKGYTDCGCNAGWRAGIVLDPFVGSGTTCVLAKKLGVHYVGIDVNTDYIAIAEKRVNSVQMLTLKKEEVKQLDMFKDKEAPKITGHRWSGWPGAWCLDCGCECPAELEVAGQTVPPDHPGFLPCIEPNSHNHDPYEPKDK